MADNKVRTIFVVDDDPMQLQMLKDHLKSRMNVTVETYSTGEECLNNLDKNPDAIVLDYHLNSVDKAARNGLDILKAIKKRSPNTEVVILSGQDKIDVAVDTMANGAFDYVVKAESAFLRTENKIKNIFTSQKLKENLSFYKNSVYVLIAALIVMIVVIGILYAKGIAKDNVGTVMLDHTVTCPANSATSLPMV